MSVGLQQVEAPRICRQLAYEGEKNVSHTYRSGHLYPPEDIPSTKSTGVRQEG